jgi:uncharacterized membrane protein (DUF4010 family)
VPDRDLAFGFAVALAVGILVGLERERRKGEGPTREAAGVRTFALAGLLGAGAFAVGEELVTAVALAFVGGAALLAYARNRGDDPGLTTEAALVTVFLVGALSVNEPTLGAGLGVAVAALLALRTEIHRFARSVITEEELHDLLLLAAAATIVLPLLPDRAVGPYDTLNPFDIWLLVVLVMAIGGVGYVAIRMVGSRAGLPLAGLAGGFVSSSATIGSMGSLARRRPELARAATAAAVTSTVATFLQMSVVIGLGSGSALRAAAAMLAAGGVAAVAFAALVMLRVGEVQHDHVPPGRPFSLRSAALFAGMISGVSLLAAALTDVVGDAGVLVSSAVGGFADAHAGGASAASQVARGEVSAELGAVAVALALVTNTLTKVVVAAVTGGWSFARSVGVGLAAVLSAIGIAAALQQAL